MAAARKKKYESIGEALALASRFALPAGAGAAGGLAGGIGLRYLVARFAPAHYIGKPWVRYVSGSVGAALGAMVAAFPLVNLKTKSGREKAYKATLPLVAAGAGTVAAAIMFGGRLLAWFRGRYPTLAALMSPNASAGAALPDGNVRAPRTDDSPTKGGSGGKGSKLTLASALKLRSAGSPEEWAMLEGRAAGVVADDIEDFPRFIG